MWPLPSTVFVLQIPSEMVHTEDESLPMKGSNRIELRGKVNAIWKRCSVKYAKFLLRSPWILLAVSSLLTLALTGAFLAFMRVRSFDQTDFLMNDGESLRNARRLRAIFGDDSVLRAHQQLNLYPTLDLIFKRKSGAAGNQTNMLDEQILDEVRTA